LFVHVQAGKHIILSGDKRLVSHRSASFGQCLLFQALYQSTRIENRHPSYKSQDRLSMTLVKSLFIFSRRLAHLLSSNVGQVVVVIIRLMISPHYKNNLKPLRSKSSKRSRMTVPFSALLPIVLVRPLTSPERIKRKPVDGMSQVLVTGKSKKYHTALAT